MKHGLAGFLAKKFINSHLTPLFVIAALLSGIIAVHLTPKEEEPQIVVPMIDMQTAVQGYSADEIEIKVTKPIEQAVFGQDGVEYVDSSSQAGKSLVTVRFKVGLDMEQSLVKIHHKIMQLIPHLPKKAHGPIVNSFSIDDVPFLVVTFSSKIKNDYELRTIVADLAQKLTSTPDVNRVDILGGRKRSVRIVADPEKLRIFGVSLVQVAKAINANDSLMIVGSDKGEKEVLDVETGGRYNSVADIEELVVGQSAGKLILLKDVALVMDGPEAQERVSFIHKKNQTPIAAVSLAFAKRKGANIVDLSKTLLNRIKAAKLDEDIQVDVVRDYGKTAQDKSNELIHHLLLATISVSLLIAFMMGLREAAVVAITIPVTLALTLALYYFLGYTLNRVTLFALIFSIGILVDDAIVVVENIERHFKKNPNINVYDATLCAVDEIGNPTVLATITVVASILPMAFVRGLMGPYMKPIPVGASMAMILSLGVAFIVTPWAAVRLLKRKKLHKTTNSTSSRLDEIYRLIMEKLIDSKLHIAIFFCSIGILLLAALSLLLLKAVKVKMLPFDNKQEFQILMDYPQNTPFEKNVDYSSELADLLLQNPYVLQVQSFTKEPAPYSFVGLVRHTFLRYSDYKSDLQVVLVPKEERNTNSHDLIAKLRPVIAQFANEKHAVAKVLEIPPEPPVMATMTAEIYAPNEAMRQQAARKVYGVFHNEPSVVDLDTTLRPERSRKIYDYDYKKGGLLGVYANDVAFLGSLIFADQIQSVLDDKLAPEGVSITLSLPESFRSAENPFRGLYLPSSTAGVVDASDVVNTHRIVENTVLHRKNLQPVVYVTSELKGSEESPIYGVLKLNNHLPYNTCTIKQPIDTISPVVRWDGEWFMTYEVFRDLGISFVVVMVLIYILILGWFKSFSVPFIIMVPIPISLIGILPGHALLGVYFTATSMIGFIAGAGIIVRNSIILTDFIEHQRSNGLSLKEAVISAGVLRFRPMLLTAGAVVVGSSVMLTDPILQGLAVSLIFGELAATLVSRFAVPVLYYTYFIRAEKLQDF